ncbi:hypothetical protein [Jiella sonneratiae]|uniref:Phosphatase n=1 Tax=Jiella sonneratiae TaxID=2816856 RepID=A0ABS3J6I2_9HYPH|nr:hypothetical protein [Jiella sonneratiae]MBO0905262.1 hypothetical protein [Jiella sonneratiae]
MELAPSHVLSIVTPGRSYLGPRDVPPDRHLKIEFDDVEDAARPGAPTLSAMREIMDFAGALPEEARLCLHGLQGVRRAPAVALGILAASLPPTEAAAALKPFCRHAPDPNLLVVALFDELLGLAGALSAACQARFVASHATLRRRGDEDGPGFDFDMLAMKDEQVRHG